MKNGNRYYNQPLYAILKRDRTGNILAYGGQHRRPVWSDSNVYIFDFHDLHEIDYSSATWERKKETRLSDGNKCLKEILKWNNLKVEDESDVFWVRLRSKKCPIIVDLPSIFSTKDATIHRRDRFLRYKIKDLTATRDVV